MLFRFDDFDRSLAMMDDLHRRLERAFQAERPVRAWFDLNETDDDLFVTADMPGVSEADLELTLQDDVLTVSGQRRIELPQGHRVHMQERKPYKFTRSFALPVKVDGDAVKANLQNGVLTLRMKKAADARPRQITVTAG